MPTKAWLRCIVVSTILALLMPVFSSVVVMPGAGQPVPLIDSIDADDIAEMTPEQLAERMESMPTREVSGLDRFTYQFSHPQYWRFYLRGVITSFVWLFLATALVSYLGRDRRSDS